MKAIHLNPNIGGGAVRFQTEESLPLYNFLTGESSVFILRHEFSGSSQFIKDLQTCKVGFALTLESCDILTLTLPKINIM